MNIAIIRHIEYNCYIISILYNISSDLGCIDINGVNRAVGEEWVSDINPCETCTCGANEEVKCVQRTCPDPITTCPTGKSPTPIKSLDGCCTSYICDCKYLAYKYVSVLFACFCGINVVYEVMY